MNRSSGDPSTLSPEAAERRRRHRLLQIRIVVVLTALLGLNYVTWRWLF